MAVVPKQNALDLLRNLVPLNTLREDALAELLDAVNFEKLKKGDYLFHEGDTDAQRVYLLSGRVALKSGRSEVDSISSGSSLAKFPLAHNIPRKFSVVAKIKTEIVRIDNELLSKLIAKGGSAEFEVSEVDVEASNDWMSQLLQSPAFQQIPAANIQNVMMRMEQLEVVAGDVIINQGEEGDYFYLINKGVCSVHQSVEGGESKEIVQLGAGDSFGEDSLLSGKPRTSSVTMLSDGILLRLSRNDFVEYVRQPLADMVDYDEAVARVAKGAVWLDVRTKSEHLSRRIPDSVLMPIETVRKPGLTLDQDKRYIIYCDDGQISMTAAYLLYERGINATVLKNGLAVAPDDELEAAGAAEGATIINLRPDQKHAAGRSSQIDTGADEQGLLKDRLSKAEEQLAATRKVTHLLKKSEEKLSAIEKEKAAEAKENRRLNEALSRFKSELAQQKIELNTAVTEQEAAEEIAASLNKADDQLRDELRDAAKRAEELESRLKEREKAFTDQGGEHQVLQGLLDETREEQAQAKEKLQQSSDEQARLQDELKASVERLDERDNQLAARKEAEAELLSKQQVLQQTLDETRAEQTRMEELLAELRDEQARLQSELEESDRQTKAFEDQVAARDKADIEQQERDREAEAEQLSQHQVQQQALDDAQAERLKADEKLAELNSGKERLQSELKTSIERLEERDNQLAAREKAEAELLSQQEALQQTLDEARAGQAQMEEALAELRDEQARLQSELEASAKQVSELDGQIASRDKADIEQQERDREAEASWRQQLDDAGKERAQADERLSEVSREQERLEDELAASCKQAEELKGQLVAQDQADAEQQRLKSELEASGKRVEELESQLEAQGQTETEQQADNRTLKQLLDEAQAEQAQTTEKLEELSGEQERLNSELEASGERVEEVEGQLATLDQANAEQQSQLHLLQQSLDEAHTEQVVTVERLSALSSERDQFESELEVSAKRVEELESERAAQGLAVTEQQQEQQALKKLLDEANTGQDEVSGRLSTLAGERDRLQSELDESGRQVKELEDQIVAQNQAGNERLAEQQQQQSSMEELQAERDRQLSDLHSEYKQLQIELDESASRIEAFEEAQTEKESAGSVVEGQVESLRQELEEANSALRVAEEHLAMRKHSLRGVVSENDEVKVLTAELETLTGALEESDKAHDEILQERDEQLIVMERLREELEIAKSRPSDESAAVLPEQDDDVAKLEKELEEVRDSLKEYKLIASADAAEGEVLRQDMDSFRHSLDERSDELDASRKGQLLLEERIEARNSEIDRLKQALEMAQIEAEEAEFSRIEALEAKKQVEQALYSTREQIEEARPRDNLADVRFADSDDALDISAGSSLKKTVVGAVLGAVVAFGLAEGLSVMGGGGELISGILGDDRVQPQVEKIASISPVPAGPVEPLVEKKPVAPISTRQVEKKRVTPTVQATSKSEISDKVAVKTDKPLRPRSERLDEPAQTEKKQARVSLVPKGPETGSIIRDRLRGGGKGPVMVYIRGGDFTMGSDRSQLASEERPAHRVAIESYAIGRFEVTFDEYAEFAEATGRRLPDDLGWGRGRRPVMNVNWEDASAYASWLSDQTGRRYRLPTEAEWEHAASGGSDTAFWWGYMFENNRANCFDCGSRWDGRSTAPVGSFGLNDYGLHNTAGNVMEWVEDCYHDSYLGSPADGSAWVEPSCNERVVRGGAFNKPADSMRTTRRSQHSADTRLFVLGFRLVRDVE